VVTVTEVQERLPLTVLVDTRPTRVPPTNMVLPSPPPFLLPNFTPWQGLSLPPIFWGLDLYADPAPTYKFL